MNTELHYNARIGKWEVRRVDEYGIRVGTALAEFSNRDEAESYLSGVLSQQDQLNSWEARRARARS